MSHVVRRLLRRPSFGTLAALIGAALVVVLATPLVGSARPKESHRATAAPRATAAAVHGRGGIAVGGRAPRKFAAAAVGAQLRVIGHGQRALFVYSGRHARALAKTGRSAGLPTAPAPKEPVAAVAPAILGRGALHEPLHVDVGRWTSAEPVAFTFQWQRCAQPVGDCVAIRGADAPDFTPEAFNARPGDLLRVVVSAWTASGGTTVVSPPTRPVEGTRPEAVRPAAIHGDPRDGGRVAATAGEWASLEPFTLEFQWQRCAADGASCADIAGATAPDYVAGPLDVGSRLRAVVRAADGTGAASEPSALSDVVAAEKPRAADPPRVVGRGVVGASLLALAQYWYGTPPFTRDFQWLRCDASGKVCLPIAGATSPRYTVTAADSGGAVAVEVTAHNAAGPGSTISEPLAIEPPEASNAPPPGTTTDVPDTPKRSLSSARRALTTCVQNPTIVSPPGQSPTGSIHVGGTITITTPGSWSPPAGTCPDWDYDYAWFRDGGLLSHAKGTPPGNTTYGTGGADLGHSIEAQITYEYIDDSLGAYHGTSYRPGAANVTNDAPSPPDLPSPSNGATYTYQPGGPFSNPAMSARYWDPSGDAGYLNFSVQKWNGSAWGAFTSGDAVPQNPPCGGAMCNGGSGGYFPALTLGPGSYAWSVRGHDVWGAWGPSIGSYYLYVWSTPSAPTLSSPGNGAVLPSPQAVLAASATDAENDPIYYRVQIANDSASSSLAVDAYWLPTGNFPVPPGSLVWGHQYWWRMMATDVDGQSVWSAVRTFSVRSRLNLGADPSWPMWSMGSLAVNEATGNLLVSAPSPSFPTSAGSLGLNITYNSFDTANRGLGAGWSVGTYDSVRLVDHARTDGQDAVERVYPDGSSEFYQHVAGSLTYLPPGGSTAQLTTSADGSKFTLVDDDLAVYTFVKAADYSTSGFLQLSSVESLARGMNAARLSYGFDTSGRLTTVTARDGSAIVATLSLTWGCTGALLCISGPDAVTWKYVGDAAGNLAQVHDGTRTLLSLAYANGRPQYVYNANDLDPTHASPGYNASHRLTLAYDTATQPRVVSVTSGPVTGQTTASAWSFEYHPDTSGATKTDPTSNHGGQRIADGSTYITPPCQQSGALCPGRTGARSRVLYDNYGRVIERVDPLGNAVQQQFNDQGQPLWSEDQYGNPTDYVYDSVDHTLSSVEGPDPDAGGPLPRRKVVYNYDELAYGTVAGQTYTPGSAQEGVQAFYYKTPSLLNAAGDGRPDGVASEASTNGLTFSWGSVGPTALPGTTTNYSVRLLGDLVTPAGALELALSSDAGAGARLILDGQLVVDNWDGTKASPVMSKQMTPGTGKHRFALDYKETNTAPSSQLALKYCTDTPTNCASNTALWNVVPSSWFRPAWGNRTSAVSPSGRVSFSHFNAPWTANADYTLAVVDFSSLITSFVYDSNGRVVQKVMPKGNTSRSIDSTGTLGGTPDATFATTYAYYGATATATTPALCGTPLTVSQLGRLQSIAVRGLHDVTTVYDAAGRPTAIVNGAGTSVSCFDAEGRLAKLQAAGDAQPTTFTYDPAGNELQATHPTGTDTTAGTIARTYDENGRLVEVVDASGAEAKYSYDPDGNVVSRVADKAAVVSGSPVTTYSYDDAGQLVGQIDSAGRSYSFFYDKRGSLKATQYPNGTFSWEDFNPDGSVAALYNRHGSLTAPLPATAPADGSPIADFAYTYDIDGQRVQDTRTAAALAAVTDNYAYDSLGRLISATLPDLTSRRYCYDADSNRTAVMSLSTFKCGTSGAQYPGAVVFDAPAAYWRLGESSGTALIDDKAGTSGSYIGGVTLGQPGALGSDANTSIKLNGSTGYASVADGPPLNPTSAITLEAWVNPAAGSFGAQKPVILKSYTSHANPYYQYGLLLNNSTSKQQVRFWLAIGGTQVLLDGFFGWKFGVWTHLVATYDGQTMRIYSNGKEIASKAQTGSISAYATPLTLGAYANLAKTSSYLYGGGIDEAAVYPVALTAAQVQTHYQVGRYGPVVASYTYDPAVTGGVDQLTSTSGAVGTTAYSYSSDGQITGRGTDTVSWDGYGRMKGGTFGSTSVGYTFDPEGGLRSRAAGTSTTNYLLGDLYETDGTGAFTTAYVDGPTGDLSSFSGGPTSATPVTYLYYSGHGDLAAEADSTGARTAVHAYDPFGSPLDTQPANATLHRFVGAWDKQYDTSSGLILMGARPYDPAVGRFLAVDPVDGGSLNNYDYAGQDPINNYDLDGTMTPGPPGVGWPAGIAFSGYCGGFCGGIESSAPTMSQRRAAVETALFFGLPGVLKGAEIAAATVWGTRAGVVAAERAEIAIAAHEATPPNVSRLGEVAHVAGHVAYPSVKAAVAKAAPRVAKAAIRRAKSGAAIGLRQLGR